eukprot:gene2258-19920_t
MLHIARRASPPGVGARGAASGAGSEALFRDSNATGLIRCAWAIGSLLNAVVYSPSVTPRVAISSYALLLWTYVTHVAPGTLSTLYPHELVAHLGDLGDLPVPSIFLSDDRGEGLIRFVAQVLRGGSHDWTLYTGQVLEWWRGQQRVHALPGGGRPPRPVPLGTTDDGMLLVNPAASGGAMAVCGCMVAVCDHIARVRDAAEEWSPLPAAGLEGFLTRGRPDVAAAVREWRTAAGRRAREWRDRLASRAADAPAVSGCPWVPSGAGTL